MCDGSPVAGGMGHGAGTPMWQRVQASSEAGEPPCPARHCWVLDPVDASGTKRAGLLLEWRRDASAGWEGRVVYVALLRTEGWVSVEDWLPAAWLAPAE